MILNDDEVWTPLDFRGFNWEPNEAKDKGYSVRIQGTVRLWPADLSGYSSDDIFIQLHTN